MRHFVTVWSVAFIVKAHKSVCFSKALTIALSIEAADKNTQQLKGGEQASTVSYQSSSSVGNAKGKGSSKPKHYRCGSTKYKAKSCKFKDTVCHNCGKEGHLAKVCRSKKEQVGHNHVVRESPDLEPGPQDHPLFVLGRMKNSPMVVAVAINGKNTGAARSVMSETLAKQLYPNMPLKQTPVILRTYTNEAIKVYGEFQARVGYATQVKDIPLLVIWWYCTNLDG